MADRVIDTSVPLSSPGAFGIGTDVEVRPDTGLASVGNYVRDSAIDIARGFTGIGKGLAGAATSQAIPGDEADRADRTARQRWFSDLDEYLKSGKSERGQYVEDKGVETSFVDQVVQGALQLVPYAPLALLGPGAVPAGAALFGATSYGETRNKADESLRFATPEDLKYDKAYRKLRAEGLDHEAAKTKMVADSDTLMTGLIAGGGGALGGGLLGMVGGRAGSKLISEAVANRLSQRALVRAGIGGAEGGGAGATMGYTSDIANQRVMRDVGLAGDVDQSQALKTGFQSGAVLGVIGGAAKVAAGKPHMPAAPLGVTERYAAASKARGEDVAAGVGAPRPGEAPGAVSPAEAPPRPPGAPLEGPAYMPGGEPMRGPKERIDDPYGEGPGGAHMPGEPAGEHPELPGGRMPEPPPVETPDFREKFRPGAEIPPEATPAVEAPDFRQRFQEQHAVPEDFAGTAYGERLEGTEAREGGGGRRATEADVAEMSGPNSLEVLQFLRQERTALGEHLLEAQRELSQREKALGKDTERPGYDKEAKAIRGERRRINQLMAEHERLENRVSEVRQARIDENQAKARAGREQAEEVTGAGKPEPVDTTTSEGGSWRPVDPNEVLPAGVHVRMDMTSGKPEVFVPATATAKGGKAKVEQVAAKSAARRAANENKDQAEPDLKSITPYRRKGQSEEESVLPPVANEPARHTLRLKEGTVLKPREKVTTQQARQHEGETGVAGRQTEVQKGTFAERPQAARTVPEAEGPAHKGKAPGGPEVEVRAERMPERPKPKGGQGALLNIQMAKLGQHSRRIEKLKQDLKRSLRSMTDALVPFVQRKSVEQAAETLKKTGAFKSEHTPVELARMARENPEFVAKNYPEFADRLAKIDELKARLGREEKLHADTTTRVAELSRDIKITKEKPATTEGKGSAYEQTRKELERIAADLRKDQKTRSWTESQIKEMVGRMVAARDSARDAIRKITNRLSKFTVRKAQFLKKEVVAKEAALAEVVQSQTLKELFRGAFAEYEMSSAEKTERDKAILRALKDETGNQAYIGGLKSMQLRSLGMDIAEYAHKRIAITRELYKDFAESEKAEGRSMQVNINLTRRAAGRGDDMPAPWHNFLSGYVKMVEKIDRYTGQFEIDKRTTANMTAAERAKVETEVRSKLNSLSDKQKDARDARMREILNDFYVNEMLVRTGQVHMIDAFRKQELGFLQSQFAAAKAAAKVSPDVEREFSVLEQAVNKALAEREIPMPERGEGVSWKYKEEKTGAEAMQEPLFDPNKAEAEEYGEAGFEVSGGPKGFGRSGLDMGPAYEHRDPTKPSVDEAMTLIREFVQRKMGDKVSEAVRAEVNRAVEDFVKSQHEAARVEAEREAAKNKPPEESDPAKMTFQQRLDRYVGSDKTALFRVEMARRYGQEWFSLGEHAKDALVRYEQLADKPENLKTVEEKIAHVKEVEKFATPEEYHRAQATGLMERADRLWDAINASNAVGWTTRADVHDMHRAFRDRLGEERDINVTGDTIVRDMNRAEEELGRIENELREIYETVVPIARERGYQVKGLLDPAADLSDPIQRPAGARVQKVSDFLKHNDRFYGVRPGFDIPTGEVRNLFMDVANKLAGDVEVVTVTAEQMKQLAPMRELGADTPAFWDRASDRIFITREAMTSPERGAILGHEIGHPITESALQKYPAIRDRLDQQREALLIAHAEGNMAVREALQGNLHGLRNVHEFVSELWGNPRFMEALQAVDITDAQSRKWQTEKRGTLLSASNDAIRSSLEKALFGVSRKKLLNDTLVSSMDMLQRMAQTGRQKAYAEEGNAARPFIYEASKQFGREIMEGVTEKAKDVAAWTNKNGGPSGVLLNFANFRDLARMADEGMQKVMHPIVDLLGKRFNTQKQIMEREDYPVMRALAERMRIDTSEVNKKMVDYIDFENRLGAYGDHKLVVKDAAGERIGANKHISENAEDIAHRDVHRKHERLSKAWSALTDKQKDMVRQLRDYYEKRYGSIRDAQLRQMIDLQELVKDNHPGATDTLLKYIGNEKLTGAETTLLADKVKGFAGHSDVSKLSADNIMFREKLGRLRQTPEFRKLAGPYYPMMRHGDWVVHGYYDVERHAKGGVEVNKEDKGPVRTWEFATEKEAKDFVDRLGADGEPEIKILAGRKVAYEADPADPSKIALDKDGKPKRAEYVTSTGKARRVPVEEAVDEGGHARWQVDINPHLTEFHEGRRAADARQAELVADASYRANHVQERKENQSGYMNPAYASKAMRDMIDSVKRSEKWAEADQGTRTSMEREWQEAAERILLSTSARSRYSPRKYSLGADKDLMKNLTRYSTNTSHTLAELTHRPEMSRALKAMDAHVEDNKAVKEGAAGDVGRYGLLRSQVQNETYRRLRNRPDVNISPVFDKAIQGILKLSFLDKLASPGFLLLNASEPLLLAGPMLAGRYGIGAYGEIMKAYATIGAHSAFGHAAGDVKKVWQAGLGGDPKLASNLERLKDKVKNSSAVDKEGILKMLDFMEETGYLDRNAGMELEHLFRGDEGAVMRRVDFTDHLFRQMNAQVENVNRGVVAIAAYRLEMRKKGATHESAMRRAQLSVEESAGNYAAYNAPPSFSDPRFRFALQFKKYALRITTNYLRMAVGAFRHMRGVENNPTAVKQLMFMIGSQALMAGVLGLPTEPIKAIITALNQIGVSPYNTDDIEAMMRKGAADMLGPMGGEIFSRGLMRALGTGIGERVSHSSLWTFGTLGSRPDSAATAIGHLFMGAPGGYLADSIQGAAKLFTGVGNYARGATTSGAADVTEGIRLMIPMKAASDTIGAAMEYANPKKTPAGQRLGPEMTGGQFISNVAGLRTGAQLEQTEARNVYRRKSEVFNTDRTKAIRMYVSATTPAEKSAIREGIIRNFNERYPDADQRITVGQLMKEEHAHHRRESMDPNLLGIHANKRTRGFLPSESVYRYQ
jgi:hypothetical protein